MANVEIEPEAIRAAMAHFDATIRGTRAEGDWMTGRSHRYAIEEEGRLYPVKRILAQAMDRPVFMFRSGREQANSWAERAGFRVVPLPDPKGGARGTVNPDWTREELILALDVYLRHREALPSKASPVIAALSTELRTLWPAGTGDVRIVSLAVV